MDIREKIEKDPKVRACMKCVHYKPHYVRWIANGSYMKLDMGHCLKPPCKITKAYGLCECYKERGKGNEVHTESDRRSL